MINCTEMAERVFKEMDMNHDKRVTKEEFLTVCLNNKTISQMLTSKMLKIVTTDTNWGPYFIAIILILYYSMKNMSEYSILAALYFISNSKTNTSKIFIYFYQCFRYDHSNATKKNSWFHNLINKTSWFLDYVHSLKIHMIYLR